MSEHELTSDELWLYMPKWKKALICIFVAIMPIVGSIDNIAW